MPVLPWRERPAPCKGTLPTATGWMRQTMEPVMRLPHISLITLAAVIVIVIIVAL